VSLEHLWAGWRSDYVAEATLAERGEVTEGCVFCRIAESGAPSADNGIVWRGEHCFVVLNAYPYATGHLLVLPLAHKEDVLELSDAESTELWESARHSIGALRRAYGPDGINLGANLGRAAGAGIPKHLHLHVVPRWSGDTNFMTAVGGTRVMPETLVRTWEKVSSAWGQPASGDG
jgi:ATP adenylyltransferase